jgi:cellulose synthase/poly-beta-1,6-N-acetylglucosamine synthase-like glycosyltransferase
MTLLGLSLIAIPGLLIGYAYFGYPLLLRLVGRSRPPAPPLDPDWPWPMITISLPAYNEEATIGRTIESLVALDYPADRKQILVISDASTDGTDRVVAGFASRGVELHRMPSRIGKTGAENASARLCRGEIVVNTDATIRIAPDALKPLIRVFQDPTIGVASGRDVSVGDLSREGNQGESGYVGYEMKVRALETRVGSIVGASGCYYAIRRRLVQDAFPEALSRDFASALLAREAGLRAVSVDDAACFVPRTRSLKAEYRRKVRTMARGLETLWYKRQLMNPAKYGPFSWMLVSHKLIRWLAILTLPLGAIGLVLLAASLGYALLAIALLAVGLGLAAGAFLWPDSRRLPFLLAVPGFAVGSVVAGLVAWSKALRGEKNPIWEPTRRPNVNT